MQVTIREPHTKANAKAKAGSERRARSAAMAPKVSVADKTEEQLEALKSGTPEATLTIRLMTAAADIMVVMAQAPHSAVLVAQGGLLAAAKALAWDLHADLNTASAMMVFKLATEQDAYLQMVRV
jgi:hypothetical protein